MAPPAGDCRNSWLPPLLGGALHSSGFRCHGPQSALKKNLSECWILWRSICVEDYHAYTSMKNGFFKLFTVRHNHSIQEREVLSLTKARCSMVSECKKRPISLPQIWEKCFVIIFKIQNNILKILLKYM